MTQELWKPITQYKNWKFNGSYEVSSWGNIRLTKTKKKLSPTKERNYLKIRIRDVEGIQRNFKMHRLVALYFLPKVEGFEHLEVDHLDGNPRNNSCSNLKWVAHKENMRAFFQQKKKIKEEELLQWQQEFLF